MQFTTPEAAGIKSENILRYVKKLEETRLCTHDIIIARKGKILYEAYWEPFDKDFMHRMYSVTKSFVSLAIGFLVQEGKLSLDDTMEQHFAEELKNQKDENMRKQTVRHMLMMSTAKTAKNPFVPECTDRVRFYFENNNPESRPSGTLFQYDSSGSFVLGALVERISGMDLVDYLRDRLFDKIGVSENITCLKCRGGHSWGDSALICTPRDLLLVAQFVMNKGKWNGEQILNEDYVTTATSKLIDNNLINNDEHSSQGYGYLFWRLFDNSFFFNGMGCQFAVCVPDKDIVFIYNADNQGMDYAKKVILDNFYDMIVRTAEDKALPENAAAKKELDDYTSQLKLQTAVGDKSSPIAEIVNDKTFTMSENPMGITKIKLCFDENGGVLHYTNSQGDKELSFGMCENCFGEFQQDGYSDKIMDIPGNRRYKCACSAAWVMPEKLVIKVQIIDKYFGNLHIHLGFTDDNRVGVFMTKTAEAFLEEYQGFAGGKI